MQVYAVACIWGATTRNPGGDNTSTWHHKEAFDNAIAPSGQAANSILPIENHLETAKSSNTSKTLEFQENREFKRILLDFEHT